MLDEGHFESFGFLKPLLSELSKKGGVRYLTLEELLESKLPEGLSPPHLSVYIGKLRENSRALIHHYIPHLLVRHDNSTILRMIENWIQQTRGKPILEFVTLPKGTFDEFEKKLMSLVQGTINLSVTHAGNKYFRTFSILRTCKPEYHGVSFQYEVEEDRVLIRFRDRLTDKLSLTTDQEIESRIHFLRENAHRSQIFVRKMEAGILDPVDYVLLTQLHDKTIAELEIIFPDRFEDYLGKITRWSLDNIIELKSVQPKGTQPVKPLGIAAKFALALPLPLAARILGGKPRSVPIEALLSLRKSIEVIIGKYLPETREPINVLETSEKFIHEMAARITSAERIRALGQDPRAKLEFKYVSKAISLTLLLGFGLKSKVKEKEEGRLWEFALKDCFACSGSKSSKSVCNIISGTVAGALAQPLKEKLICEEILCKASGAPECTFVATRMDASESE